MKTIDEEDEDLQAIWSQVQVNFDLAEQNVGSDSLSRNWRLITPTQIFQHQMVEEPSKLSFEFQTPD